MRKTKDFAPAPGKPGATITLEDGRTATVWAAMPVSGGRWATRDDTGETIGIKTRRGGAVGSVWVAEAGAIDARRQIRSADRVQAHGVVCVEHGETNRNIVIWAHLPHCPAVVGRTPYTGARWNRFHIIDMILLARSARGGPRLCAECIDF